MQFEKLISGLAFFGKIWPYFIRYLALSMRGSLATLLATEEVISLASK